MNIFNYELFFLLMLILGCGRIEKPAPALDKEPPIKPEVPKNEDKSNARASFMETKPLQAKGIIALTFNTDFSNHYRGEVPKAPIFSDDPKSRRFVLPWILVVANLGPSFEKNLPASIKKELQQRKLLGEAKVDIFWVVQNSLFLGEQEDYAGVATTTRLVPHGWADPDAPGAYHGGRVNRNFLLGIFDSERDIATEAFPMEKMTASPVYTHDGLFSPRPEPGTNMVRIGNEDPSQSLWSLVIDDQNPEGKVRAVATLHWVLDVDEFDAFKDLSHTTEPLPDNRSESKVVGNVKSFRELISKLNASDFKSMSMMKKLNSLLADIKH